MNRKATFSNIHVTRERRFQIGKTTDVQQHFHTWKANIKKLTLYVIENNIYKGYDMVFNVNVNELLKKKRHFHFIIEYI